MGSWKGGACIILSVRFVQDNREKTDNPVGYDDGQRYETTYISGTYIG